MREWLDKKELVTRVAQAWKDAYDTAPRDSNEHLEAAKFLAMLNAVLPGVLDARDPPEEPADAGEPPVALPSPEMVGEEELVESPDETAEEPDTEPDTKLDSAEKLPEVDYADDHSG